MFNTITSITKATSSQHTIHIIGNILLRVQAEQKFKGYQGNTSSNQAQESQVSKLAETLPDIGNSTISQDIIQKFTTAWQAHLERISDYLILGEGAWWHKTTDNSIEFFDGKGNPDVCCQGPEVHHFRSSSFEAELLHLKSCWEKCLVAPSQHISNGKLDDVNLTVEINASHTEDNGGLIDCVPGDVAEVIENREIISDNVNESVVEQPTTTFEDILPESSNEHENLHSHIYQTKMGNALLKLLGSCKDVESYDKAKSKFKNNPGNKDYLDNFEYYTVLMQTRVSSHLTQCKAQLKKWENEYFSKHGELPTAKYAMAHETSKLLLSHIKHSKLLFQNLNLSKGS